MTVLSAQNILQVKREHLRTLQGQGILGHREVAELNKVLDNRSTELQAIRFDRDVAQLRSIAVELSKLIERLKGGDKLPSDRGV